MDEFSTLLQEIQFSERFRGYDPEEVDTYMHAVAKAAAQMQGRLTELQQRVESAESRMGRGDPTEPATEETLTRTLLLAQRTADAAIAEAEAEAARLTADAEHRRNTVVAEAEERGAALLSAAQSQASAQMAEADSAASTRLRDAQDRSARILAEAEVERRRILAEAETEAAAKAIADRDLLLAEVHELEARRSTLRHDIGALDRQVSDQRAQLQKSLSALRSLIEDPANFGLVDTPPVHDEVIPTLVGDGEADVAVEASEAEPEPAWSAFEPEVEQVSSFELESELDDVSAIDVERDQPEVPSWELDVETDVARAEFDPIAEEFESTATEAEPRPGMATPVIDDYLHPGDTVETSGPIAVDEVAEADEADEAILDVDDDVEIDLDAPDRAPAEAADDVEIDLVATEAADDELDLLGEAPIDAEIVGETAPMPDRGFGGGAVVESDVRTAPPRFVTVADLDEDATAEPETADDIQIVDLGTDVQDDVDEVNDDPADVVATDSDGSSAPAATLIDFDDFESQPVTEPVPTVEPEHPSLFGAEPPMPDADDQFLAQLRQAVSSDDQPLSDADDEDALSAFFESDDEERRRGWFGRQR